MKRPVLTKDQNQLRIATAGAKAAKLKFEASRALIRTRMREIEADVEKHGGVYPYAGGKISCAEVLRRAGKSPAYLRKKEPPALVKLRDEVDAWVDRVTKDIAADARIVRKKVTDRVLEARSELNLVRQAYAETELELSDMQADLRNAEKTIEQLRGENTTLLKKLSGKTVFELTPRRK